METTSFSTCILKVNIKCCTQCQVNAKKRLEKINGVSTVSYDANGGLLKVSGDKIRPEILIEKFAKWGKKAELMSFDKNPKPKNKEDISRNCCQTCTRDKDFWSSVNNDHVPSMRCSDSTACTDDSSSSTFATVAGVAEYTRGKNGRFVSNKPNRKKGFLGLFGGKDNGKKTEDLNWEHKSVRGGIPSKKTWKMPVPEPPVDAAPKAPPPPYYPNMYGRPPPLFPPYGSLPPPLPPFLPPYGSMQPPPPPYGSLFLPPPLPPPPPLYGSMYPPLPYEFPQFNGPPMVNPMTKYSCHADNYI